MSAGDPLALTGDQERCVEDGRHHLLGLAKNNSVIRDPTDRHLYHNVVAILGPRGAGKSSILEILYQRRPEAAPPGYGCNEPRLWFLPSLDCSVLDARLTPGTAVLLRIQEQLKHRPEAKGAHDSKSAIDKLLADLHALIERFTRVDRQYKDLCMELSVSPGDYSHYVVEGLQERFGLQRDLATWLAEVSKLTQNDAIVVLLDDFDLVPAEEVRQWIVALMDELHQPRLLFVLTADLPRLQHLSWDALAGLDDMTGRALVDKLIAEHNRVYVGPWALGDRSWFPQLRPDRKSRDDAPADTLWGLIRARNDGSDAHADLIERLLPERPRGLANLHGSLKQHESKPEARTFHDLIEVLAACRQEPLLARRLRQIREQQRDWVRDLRLSSTDLDPEDWWDLVRAVRQRQPVARSHQDALLPLDGLQASQEGLEQGTRCGRRRSDTGLPTAMILSPEDTRDPSRHHLFYERPLRDAAEADAPFWTELLVDRNLVSQDPGPTMYVLNRWRPLFRRHDEARLRLSLSRPDIRDFFEWLDDAGYSGDIWPALSWLRLDPAGGHPFSLEVGWTPMIESLRRGENRSIPALTALLNIAAPPKPEVAVDDDAVQIHLLPGRLWAMVLLIDALERCPWQELCVPRLWGVATYLGLAAGLVKTAYAHALLGEHPSPSPAATCPLNPMGRCATRTQLQPLARHVRRRAHRGPQRHIRSGLRPVVVRADRTARGGGMVLRPIEGLPMHPRPGSRALPFEQLSTMAEKASGSSAETLAWALALVDNTLVDDALFGLSLPQAIACRLGDLGIDDEPTAQRCARRATERVEPKLGLIALVDDLFQLAFRPRHGLPVLDTGPLARRLARALDFDLLACLSLRDLPRDEPYDWSAINLTDEDPGAAVLRQESIETHIHLGGALPPLYYWLILMSGTFPLEALRWAKSSNPARRHADDDRWQGAILRAAALRLKIADRVRKCGHDFAWLPAFDTDLCLENPSIAIRDLVARWSVAQRFSRFPGVDRRARPLFADPLRDWSGDQPIHYASLERRLIYHAGRLIRRDRTPDLERQLFEYMRIRNAFHAWMAHDYGSDGLARFSENFDRRGFLFHGAGASRRNRRQQRVLTELERERVFRALRSQVHEPYCEAHGASELHQPLRRIELRVSPPGKRPLRVLRAWLDGLCRFLDQREASRPTVPRVQAAFVIHFLKRRVTGHSAGELIEREIAERTAKRNEEIASNLWFMLRDYPDLRRFFAGIDAAGQERIASPRVFVGAFHLLIKKQAETRVAPGQPPLRLGLTYHVGEDIEDLLTGLRHLDEVASLLFRGQPGRLGHALALGEDPKRHYARRGGETEVRVGSHLLDLVWLYGRLLGNDEQGMIDSIRHRIEEIIREHGDKGPIEIDRCWRAMGLDGRAIDPALGEHELLDQLGCYDGRDTWCTVTASRDWLAIMNKVQSLLRQRFASMPLCIESNPTSNLLVGGYSDYGELPYGVFTDAGLSVSINTDDPGLFCTTLPGEMSAMYQTWRGRTGSHRAAIQWLEERLQDARRSTFLGPQVPIGRDVRAILRDPEFGRFIPMTPRV